jgi:hypothetical protein
MAAASVSQSAYMQGLEQKRACWAVHRTEQRVAMIASPRRGSFLLDASTCLLRRLFADFHRMVVPPLREG